MKKLFLLLLLAGCSAKSLPTVPTPAPPTPTRIVPETSTNGHKAIEQIDPKSILPVNNGYSCDINDDGVLDLVIMHGNVLYFKNAQQGEEIPILKVNAEVIAYRIDKLPNIKRPSLIFYDKDCKGYLQENLGSVNGIPYFGDVEALEK